MSTILVTGAATGFGNLTAKTLARAGHTAYASMRNTETRNAPRVEEVREFAAAHDVDLRSIELDVQSQESCDAAVGAIRAEQGELDVVVHNAGHMVVGPTEAFTPEEIIDLIDINALGAQRVNHAVLPHMRERGEGLLLWVGSTTSEIPPPFLGPYCAAKAAMDALASVTAYEVAPFGIETSMVVPGAYTSGTSHFANAGHPADEAVVASYQRIASVMDHIQTRLEELTPADADVQKVADEITRVVGLPAGSRPMRTVIDPIDDGAAAVLDVMVERRTAFMNRLGLEQMLHPAATAG
jgi:NAD(P)-dependent dehydrogenase (short-subunit alcohol dehydrogenase family)